MIGGLPGVLAGIVDRGHVAIPHRCHGRQQVGFVAESDLAFLLHHLEGQDHISSFVPDLPLELDFRAVAQNEQSCAGEPRDDQNERRQQFRAEFQNAGLSGLRAPRMSNLGESALILRAGL